MTDRELRLELLKITRPSFDNPEASGWIARAAALEAYVHGAGQLSQEIQHDAVTQAAPKARTPRTSK